MARVSYSDAKRKKAIQFIRDWDDKHGRGGTAQAMRTFKITFPTLKNWMAGSGMPVKKTGLPKAVAVPATTARKTAKSSGVRQDILAHLDKIARCQLQIDALRDQIEKEKTEIRTLLG